MKLSRKMTLLVLCAGWLVWATPECGLASVDGGSLPTNAITPNEYEGSDVERINRAIEVAAEKGGRVVIPRENVRGEARSDLWLLDSAILLRGNTTLELDNCRIKLSDRCRDNMMRNVKVKGVTTNLHVRGIGTVILEGADHPRSTAFGGWILGKHTYGTDGGVAGEKQGGDRRNFGILLTSVEDFSLENFTIKDSHSFAIDLEQCARGTLRDLGLASSGFKIINGVRQRILNQDGIDLRNGCHDILVENITGHTGDDLIALNGIAASGRYRGGGDIHHITIRNIKGYSAGACNIIRLLNFGGLKIHDILIDGLTDTTPVDRKKGDLMWGPSLAAVNIGEPGYGGIAPAGDTFNVTIRNVTSRARYAILIAGSLSDSSISNVVHYGTNEPVTMKSGPEYVRNVTITDVRRITNSLAAEVELPRLRAATDEAVGVALRAQAPHAVLDDARPVAHLRFLVAGDQLCVAADVEDPRPVQMETVWQGACLEVFGSMPNSLTIGQVFLVPAVDEAPAKAYRNEAGKQMLAPDIGVSSQPIAKGYRIEAHIPLVRLAIDPAKDLCLLEFQVTTTGALDAAGQRTPLHVTLFKSRLAHMDNYGYARVHLKTLPP